MLLPHGFCSACFSLRLLRKCSPKVHALKVVVFRDGRLSSDWILRILTCMEYWKIRTSWRRQVLGSECSLRILGPGWLSLPFPTSPVVMPVNSLGSPRALHQDILCCLFFLMCYHCNPKQYNSLYKI